MLPEQQQQQQGGCAASDAAAAGLVASSPPRSPGPVLAAQLQRQQKHMAGLANGGAATAPLLSTPLARLPLSALHPSSWFAVAWYPACRLPDSAAQLTSRFLTFHSLAALAPAHASTAVTVTGAPLPQDVRLSSLLPPGSATLPVVGLMWNNLQGEAPEWLGAVASPPTTAKAAAAVAGGQGASAAASAGSPSSSASTLQTISDLRAALAELRGTAARLARGSGILVEQRAVVVAAAGAAAAGQEDGTAAPAPAPIMREQHLHVSDYDFFERTLT